jgi:hypothetical protein
LDDQSLRDGRLIPNNSQITTVVFLDKGSVTLDFKSACDRLYNGYDVASVSAVKVHHEDQRQDELQEQQQSSTFATLESKSVAAKIGSQNKQAAKRYESCAAGDSSALKEALGALILVGDEIQFLERVVVDQSVRSQETPVGAQPDSSTISYQKLSITGRNLDKLPGSLNIISGTTSRTATRDTTSTAEAATYSFKSPLPSNAAYTVNAAGSGLPIALHGNVTNPDAQITGASITNDIMTVTGSELDLLSGALTVSIGDKPVNLQMSAPPSATTATYTLDPARDTKAKFAIESKPGVKVNPSPLTPTVK